MTYVFGKKIKELRKGQCLTLEEVAKRTGTSKGYISDIENSNRRPPSDKIIRKLSRVLKVNKKILLRLAHIDKIPEDIKQELQLSKIISPKNIVEETGNDLNGILKETYKRKKKMEVDVAKEYLPIINDSLQGYPNTDEIESLCKDAKDFVQFSIPDISVAFAIRIPDDAMERKWTPSFKKGSLVFFSENTRVRKENFVFVAYQSEEGVVTTFRQLKICDRSKVQLAALHPRMRKELVLPRRAVKKMWKAVGYLDIL